jgi:agmatinase
MAANPLAVKLGEKAGFLISWTDWAIASIVPGVIGRAPGGLTYWNVVDLLHGISTKGSIAGFTLVEFMPDSDVDGIGALNNAQIICNVLGLVARQS